MPNVTVTFEMSNGQELKCEYGYRVIYGNISGPPEYCYPDETDVGEPTYYLDGDEIDVADLPKGLDVIAEVMYESGESDSRFTYKESEPDYDGPDFEPDDY